MPRINETTMVSKSRASRLPPAREVSTLDSCKPMPVSESMADDDARAGAGGHHLQHGSGRLFEHGDEGPEVQAVLLL